MRCQEQSSIVLMIMSVMIQERQEIYLLGEFLSCTVNAVTVISITNSSEVLDTIATVRIGCWCQDCGFWGSSRRISRDQRGSWRIRRGECECPANFMVENPISFCIFYGAGSCCR